LTRTCGSTRTRLPPHGTKSPAAPLAPGSGVDLRKLKLSINAAWAGDGNKAKLAPLLDAAWAGTVEEVSPVPVTDESGGWVVRKLEEVRAMQESLAKLVASELSADEVTTASKQANVPVRVLIQK
jgi:hypothetical protein